MAELLLADIAERVGHSNLSTLADAVDVDETTAKHAALYLEGRSWPKSTTLRPAAASTILLALVAAIV